jgi:hypothetical protein
MSRMTWRPAPPAQAAAAGAGLEDSSQPALGRIAVAVCQNSSLASPAGTPFMVLTRAWRSVRGRRPGAQAGSTAG